MAAFERRTHVEKGQSGLQRGEGVIGSLWHYRDVIGLLPTDDHDATVVAPSRKKQNKQNTVAALCGKQMAAAEADCVSLCLSGCSFAMLAYCNFHSLCYILVCAASLTTGNKGSIERRQRRPFDG